MSEEKRFETAAIRTQAPRSQAREHSVPLFLTSSFTFPDAGEMRDAFAGESDAYIYSRYANPNVQEFIDKVCLLEGMETGFATASGMSAIFAGLMAFLKSGDHVLATRAVFGSTHQILTQLFPRWGIDFSYLDPEDTSGWDAHVRPNTRILLLETPSNPGLVLVDLEAAGKFARSHGLIFMVDNCFASPYLQQPARYGADLVIHSGTKWMDGQGRVLGGILTGRPDLIDAVTFFCRHTGPSISPFNAWVLSKSLETLSVRMERHCANALALAQWLETQDAVEKVSYPFLPSHPQHELARRQMKAGGGLVTFTLKGGMEACIRFLNHIRLCSLSSNLGDTRTILTHPATTTHSKLTEEERLAVGISPGLIRVSVGLEHIDDVVADFSASLGQ